ncbi:MAG: molybdopterin molybdotransferase MoeA [Acidimicrobiales bacterium]
MAEAQATILAACRRLAPVEVPLDDALGLVTATALVARDPVPPFDNTAMDGFAVRAADTAAAPVELRIIATTAAGAPPGPSVGPGEAVRIMTGAPLPPGADAVVMVERTHDPPADRGGGQNTVVVEVTVPPGDHVRRAGEDLARGQEAFPAGTFLAPGHLGVMASLGLVTVAVVPRPRVGVLSTGDELVEAPTPLGPGQIRDSNRHTLLALVRQSGFEPVDLGGAPDDPDRIATAVLQAVAGCDAVVCSGGVSVGDFDHVTAVIQRYAPATTAWMQVAVRPAKPLAFGVVDGVPVFGLPGNPVSSMVSFELFARPALRHMAGHLDLDRRRVRAVAPAGLPRRPDGKLHLVRVRLTERPDGRHGVEPVGGAGSHLLHAMALANGLALVPDGDGVPPGGDVEVMVLA